MFDKPEMYAWYLPSPLRPWSTAWSATVYRLGAPRLMGHLAFRAIRRSDEAAGGTMPETG
jgi:hypothetical protein